nr:2-dehydropantoate 2-reductase N-terminal domain-containing protein [Phyllobacterium sp. IY22]
MTKSRPLKVCIYGAGAIGRTMGVLLALAGAEVSVIAHDATLAAIKNDGLQLMKDGKAQRVHVRATDDPSQLEPQDYVIVSVKTPSLEDVGPDGRLRRLHGLLCRCARKNPAQWWKQAHYWLCGQQLG